MSTLRVVKPRDPSESLSGAVLFGLLWTSLVDLLGQTATAVLVRRAARRALPRSAELGSLCIERVDDRYGYVVPVAFALGEGPPPSLMVLASELRPLLLELTGEVAQRHLDRVPELRAWVGSAARAA